MEQIKIVNSVEFLEVTPPTPEPILISREELENQLTDAIFCRDEQQGLANDYALRIAEKNTLIEEIQTKLGKFTPVKVLNKEPLEI